MKGLIVAIQFMTWLPTPRVTVSDADFAASMRWFPAVGLIVGGIVWAGAATGGRIDPWIGALAALLVWVTVTGALHLDGLGDIADASGAAHKHRDKLLSVLADPHIGSFAAVAIALQLIAKLVLLHTAIETGQTAAIALVPFAARIAPLVWTRWLPSLHQGLAARFRDAVRPVDLSIWIAALAVAIWFVPALLVTLLLVPLWAWWLMARIGGISGDGHGAGIELVETGLLLALVIVARTA
jgi:adenosylcobinamide-GDP ribazoletransferase